MKLVKKDCKIVPAWRLIKLYNLCRILAEQRNVEIRYRNGVSTSVKGRPIA